MIQITDAELEIMNVIWDKQPINTNDITLEVVKKKSWTDRTIHTLISRLSKKGVITYTKVGKIYVYSALIKKEEYIKSESKSFLSKFFNGAFNKMAMNFIENDILSEEEIKELKEILNKR